MKNRFSDFQKKRMFIFGEVVRRYWNGQLHESSDLQKLAVQIQFKFGFEQEDLPFIADHIRIALGQNPRGSGDFEDELDLIRNSHVIGEPVVAKIEGACEHCLEDKCKCIDTCKYEAHVYKRSKEPVIVHEKCLSCGHCVSSCDYGALADKMEFVPIIDLLKDSQTEVYATVAPSVVGQFGDGVTLGQIRTGLKMLGFTDIIEVALFADILTIKEAFEFNQLVKSEDDFFLTSCCCPVWFNLTQKHYPEIFKKMSPSVSPMIASGRVLKELYPTAVVVFIAPCIAKKAEVKEQVLKGAIDYVINFRELAQIFSALNIDLQDLPPTEKDQASFAGRLYARTGGVSFSVKTVVNRLEPLRVIKLKAKKVDGIEQCKELLDTLGRGGHFDFNFIEGMGCKGGCVGGPRTNINVDKATKLVNEFGEDSLIMTPFDNLNVMKILRQMGINTIEEMLEHEALVSLLSRKAYSLSGSQ